MVGQNDRGEQVHFFRQAAHQGRQAADVVREMKANGESIPEPLSSRRYSGKFMVRVPPELHRQLVLEAAEEDISLNRLVSAKLSS